MCSHDWGKKNILGNLNKNTFTYRWLSENVKNLDLIVKFR